MPLPKGIIYLKGKGAKNYRKGIEYGSARWGTAEDIKPYMDEKFSNNILLTNTERITMNSRPKNPKYARNKSVMIIGGSGSGKNKVLYKTQLNANALIVCSHRSERYCFD